ncbi:hypothetical protein AKJ62_02520 [candidate division MSBL1 archaeon SCGC-AAA259D14]|uniref:Transposase IS4-like domain-containing protein n=2 Tax=candidate division MSBL1 TaxID=215777 RepID=A0A133U6A4_9EURY|nr:hypothetical protein AKJ62_02520 [candidate division MSBL1 archaeon SCGC-AAA259D14]KXA93808.1 hypothetical protein AKJ66_00865 [candidate division MSBL1 archaeon SCGC-AAA259E22]
MFPSSLLNLVEEVAEDPKDVTLIFDRGCNDEDLIRLIEESSSDRLVVRRGEPIVFVGIQ